MEFPKRTLSTSDGLDIAVYSEWKTSPGVVLLHGGGQSAYAWQQTMEQLRAHGVASAAMDLRGHGDSQWAPNGNYELEAFADDVVRVVHECCDAPPIIVGASLGGVASLLACAANESLAAGLVMVDITLQFEARGIERILNFLRAHPNGFATLEEAAEHINAYQSHRGRRSDPERLKRHLRKEEGRWVWRWDPALTHGAEERNARWTAMLEHSAGQLTCPVQLISGGQSDIVSEATIRNFMERISHASHVEIDDAHHMVAGDENDRFCAAITGFIRQHLPITSNTGAY